MACVSTLARALQGPRGMTMKRSLVRRMGSALAAGLVLGASGAWAEAMEEMEYFPREELSRGLLQGHIGLATVQVGPGVAWVLPRFEPSGEQGFRAAGTVTLAQTQALSGWTLEEEALRRYPVLARRGSFLLLVVNLRTGEQAWLREQPEPGPRPVVRYEPDAEGPSTTPAPAAGR
ncbi:hypothetical protein P2318_14020 [Myxococcaceae bacterium GXIMD 01537]